MSKEAARRVLELSFTDQDRTRMHELAERNRRGLLSDDAAAELDNYIRVGTLLTTLKLRARRILSPVRVVLREELLAAGLFEPNP